MNFAIQSAKNNANEFVDILRKKNGDLTSIESSCRNFNPQLLPLNSALVNAQGTIKRAIQDHFLCKLKTMIANTVFVGLSGDRLVPNILPPLKFISSETSTEIL